MTTSPLAAAGAALTLAVAAWLPSPAAAQVIRCTDPASGKVTYTDGDCRRGEAAREVEARKPPEAIRQEREQAAEALERKRERQQQEAQQRRDAQQAARGAPSGPYRDSSGDPAYSLECQRARKSLQEVLATLGQGMYDEQTRLDVAQRQADLACLSPADYARTEGNRSYRSVYTSPYYTRPAAIVPPHHPLRPPPQQREIANCNVFRCYDGKGNVYPR